MTRTGRRPWTRKTPLSAVRKAILYFLSVGVMPTLRDIQDYTGASSTSVTQSSLDALEETGEIIVVRNKELAGGKLNIWTKPVYNHVRAVSRALLASSGDLDYSGSIIFNMELARGNNRPMVARMTGVWANLSMDSILEVLEELLLSPDIIADSLPEAAAVRLLRSKPPEKMLITIRVDSSVDPGRTFDIECLEWSMA